MDFILPVIELRAPSLAPCRLGRPVPSPVEGQGAACLLGLRIELSDGNSQLSAGFEHPDAGYFQGKVFMVGSVYDLVEGRVSEGFPPGVALGWSGLHPFILCLQPLGRNGDFGSNIVWTHLHAAAEQKERTRQDRPSDVVFEQTLHDA